MTAGSEQKTGIQKGESATRLSHKVPGRRSSDARVRRNSISGFRVDVGRRGARSAYTQREDDAQHDHNKGHEQERPLGAHAESKR